MFFFNYDFNVTKCLSFFLVRFLVLKFRMWRLQCILQQLKFILYKSIWRNSLFRIKEYSHYVSKQEVSCLLFTTSHQINCKITNPLLRNSQTVVSYCLKCKFHSYNRSTVELNNKIIQFFLLIKEINFLS